MNSAIIKVIVEITTEEEILSSANMPHALMLFSMGPYQSYSSGGDLHSFFFINLFIKAYGEILEPLCVLLFF